MLAELPRPDYRPRAAVALDAPAAFAPLPCLWATNAVPPIGRTDNREKSLILVNRNELAIAHRVADRREVTRKQVDHPQNWFHRTISRNGPAVSLPRESAFRFGRRFPSRSKKRLWLTGTQILNHALRLKHLAVPLSLQRHLVTRLDAERTARQHINLSAVIVFDHHPCWARIDATRDCLRLMSFMAHEEYNADDRRGADYGNAGIDLLARRVQAFRRRGMDKRDGENGNNNNLTEACAHRFCSVYGGI